MKNLYMIMMTTTTQMTCAANINLIRPSSTDSGDNIPIEENSDIDILHSGDESPHTDTVNDKSQVDIEDEVRRKEKVTPSVPMASSGRLYSFKSDWKKKFSWLQIVSLAEHKVICTLCSSEKINSPWATGKILPTWRIDALKYHETKDKDHAKAVENNHGRSLKNIETAVCKAQTKTSEDICKIMRKVLYLVQSNIPLQQSTTLHDFLLFYSNKNLPNCHKSSFSTYQFLTAINEDLLQKDVEMLNIANCFSIHVDESTDITEQKHMMLYCTLWNPAENIVQCNFLKMLHITHADAESLCNVIVQFFEQHNIPLSKLVGFTSDGASVMLGSRKGVAKLLKNRHNIPNLIDNHCVAHREALALKDILNAKKSPHFWDIEQKTKELVAFLSLQTTRNELATLCDVMEEIYLSPKRIYEIRWLSRQLVVNNLTRMMEPILLFLKSKDSMDFPNLRDLQKRITDFKYWLSLFHLLDILDPLANLCRQFQKDFVHPFDIPELVHRTCSILEDRYMGEEFIDGPAVTKFYRILDDNSNRIITDHLLKPNSISDEARVPIEREVKALTEKLVNRLKDRLLTTNSSLVSAFRIFIPTESMSTFSARERLDFGKSELEHIHEAYVSHFSLAPLDDIWVEWEEFKRFLLFPATSQKSCATSDWLKICSTCAGKPLVYPNLSKICTALLCLNAQNAVVERGFSIAHGIKTKNRARLKVKTLDCLVRVKERSEPYNTIDLTKAYNFWKQKSERGRYNIGQPCKKLKRSRIQSESESEDDEIISNLEF